MKKNLTKIYNIFKQIENLNGSIGWDQTISFYYFYENNDLVRCWELLYGLFSENRNISLMKFGVDINLSELRKLAFGRSCIYEFDDIATTPVLVATFERNGKHQISGTVKIEDTDITEEKTVEFIDGVNVSEDDEDSDKTKIINSLKLVHDFNEIYVVDNNTIYCNTYDEIVENFITYLLNDLGFTAKTKVTKVPSVQTDFYWDINISEINKIDESFDLKLTGKLKTELLTNKNISLKGNVVYFTDDQDTIDDVFSVFDSENQYFDVEWEWNYDGLGNNRGIINEKHINIEKQKIDEKDEFFIEKMGINWTETTYKNWISYINKNLEETNQYNIKLNLLMVRYNISFEFIKKYLIELDNLTLDQLLDLDYVEDRLDVHLEDNSEDVENSKTIPTLSDRINDIFKVRFNFITRGFSNLSEGTLIDMFRELNKIPELKIFIVDSGKVKIDWTTSEGIDIEPAEFLNELLHSDNNFEKIGKLDLVSYGNPNNEFEDVQKYPTFQINGVTPDTLGNVEEVSLFLDYLYDDCHLLGYFHLDDPFSDYTDGKGTQIFTDEQQLLYGKYVDDIFEMDADGISLFKFEGYDDAYDYCMNYRKDTHKTMEDYIKHIASDFQFDINSDDYMGFLNTDPSNSGEWTDLALNLVENHENYKPLLIKYNLEIESADNEELIFNLINEPIKK